MRIVDAKSIIEVVEKLSIDANYNLPIDVYDKITKCKSREDNELTKNFFDIVEENIAISKEGKFPLCQDTGFALVFVEIGREVFFDGDLDEAINIGVRNGYEKGYLRKSIVKDPIDRINTGDNTPAIIYKEIVSGDKIKITVAPKGAGSENMSRIKMLKPSDGILGIKNFVYETIKLANANPCPPIVVGIGIGGTFDKCALLAKKALLLPLDKKNDNEFYNNLEKELYENINKMHIGAQGLGGNNTCLAVKILTMSTHIACLPVAVNINCHVARHSSIVI